MRQGVAITTTVIMMLLGSNLLARQQGPVWIPMHVLVLGVSTNYADAYKKMSELSIKSDMPIMDDGRKYDPKKKMFYYPNEDGSRKWDYTGRLDNCPYKDINGKYQDNGRCLSVEKSDHYQGMKSGLYVIVGGAFRGEVDIKHLEQELLFLQKWIPDAYIKKVTIDGSCGY